MSATELRTLRGALTQDALARALGVSRRTVVYWEAGAVPIPELAARVMRLSARMPGLLEALKTENVRPGAADERAGG